MKTFTFLNLQIRYFFSIRRCKRIVYSIPDWADDAHLRHGNISDDGWGTPDGKDKICYYKGSKPYFIDLPDSKESVQVSLTPLYDTSSGIRKHSTGRTIVIDFFN